MNEKKEMVSAVLWSAIIFSSFVLVMVAFAPVGHYLGKWENYWAEKDYPKNVFGKGATSVKTCFKPPQEWSTVGRDDNGWYFLDTDGNRHPMESTPCVNQIQHSTVN